MVRLESMPMLDQSPDITSEGCVIVLNTRSLREGTLWKDLCCIGVTVQYMAA